MSTATLERTEPDGKRHCDVCDSTIARIRKDRANKYCSRRCLNLSHGTTEDRFWLKVDKNGPMPRHCPELGPCWVWTGHIMPQTGYGQLLDRGGAVTAHRVAWEIQHGEIPSDDSHHGTLFVLHKCDNRPCVRGSHLFLGNAAKNTADMVSKGRSSNGVRPKGESHANSKLTDEKVLYVRRRHAEGGITLRALAAELDVSAALIGYVVRRKFWTHLPSEQA